MCGRISTFGRLRNGGGNRFGDALPEAAAPNELEQGYFGYRKQQKKGLLAL